jgi:hypothetical protein
MSKITVNRNVNYTNIDNTILQSKTLSFKAKGLFAYMWSLPNDWDYSIKLHLSQIQKLVLPQA